MRIQIDAQLDYNFPQPADVLLALKARPLDDQIIVSDSLDISGNADLGFLADADASDTRCWMAAAGPVSIRYTATVDVTRGPVELAGKHVPPRAQLPADVISYLMPSHYCCGADVEAFARNQLSDVQGGDQVLKMADWIFNNFEYVPGASDADTTAEDTFHARKGVCRDYAHVLITFARAVGIPARMVSAYAPNIQPPDFHAVVEVWLDDGWHLVDPTRLARPDNMVRIITGRDAIDISFMTVFGIGQLNAQNVSAIVLDDAESEQAA
ncbi:transglutaminase-like domain-containing protein [Henriciella litoralis]|uniref:transglutaminase-like domain-containing protein n=1 Tax=Henriciella litoralis TaxID=568102 RepID=UPI0009FF9159|nr:transglutaminase domain-containing protein [Henriciella litoralis]